ncbi:MAG: hypothetical protein ACLUOI_25445 [Eisenbergiella sp.]
MIISFFKIILSILVPMILSLMLNEVTKSWFKRSVQTIVFIPYFFSWAILAGMILEIFAYDGIINNTMLHLFGTDPTAFLVSNKYFRTIIIGSDVWKGMGYNTKLQGGHHQCGSHFMKPPRWTAQTLEAGASCNTALHPADGGSPDCPRAGKYSVQV